MHIQVNDVNEHAPVFKEKSYQATAVEGRRHESILRVEAVDADCSPQFSQICSYEIVTPNVPFTVDKDGETGLRGPIAGVVRAGRPAHGDAGRAGGWAAQTTDACAPQVCRLGGPRSGCRPSRVPRGPASWLPESSPGGETGTLVSGSPDEDAGSSVGAPPRCFT